MLKRRLWVFVTLLLMTGCAGLERECSSVVASNIGADWVIVQYRMDGTPIYCWKLNNVAIVNEQGSDGIYWKDGRTGHLIHLSGWYNRVQVEKGDFADAARLIGAEADRCL